MAMADVLQRLEVAGIGQHQAAVRHGGLDDHAGDLLRVLLERALGRLRIVERHGDDQVDELLGQAQRLRDRTRGGRAGPRRSRGGNTDTISESWWPWYVPSIFRISLRPVSARMMRDGVERGLGPGVAEPPVRQPEPLREQVRHDERVLGRLREVRSQRDPLPHGLHDLRVGVAHDHDAVAVVVVDVLVLVDVPDVRTGTASDVDRVRRPRLPRRAHAAGQPALRLLPVGQAPRVLLVERRDLGSVSSARPAPCRSARRRVRSRSPRSHLRDGHQVVEDLAGTTPTISDRCPSSSKQPGRRARHVRGQPLPVRERHHQVLRALPDGHGHADRGEVEPPRMHERDVVVEPSPDARRRWTRATSRSRGRRTLPSAPRRRPATPGRRAPSREIGGVACRELSASRFEERLPARPRSRRRRPTRRRSPAPCRPGSRARPRRTARRRRWSRTR